MDYEFRPRDKNKTIASRFVRNNHIIVDNIAEDYFNRPDVINSMDLFSKITNQTTGYDSTYLGSLIESLRLCRCVVGNLESHLSHLALLLKKPFICIDNKMTLDAIGLLNPFKVPIIFADNIEEGLEKYETNIRFAKCRVG